MKVLVVIIGLFIGANIYGQDLHFSQYLNAPMLLNPALTGLFNGDVRASANFRTQWGSVTTPYNTYGVHAEGSLFRGKLDPNLFGVGLQLLGDKAGDGELTHNQALLSASYGLSLNGFSNHFFSVGAQLGYGNQRLNMSKLTFDSQYDGFGLNENISSGEQFDRESVSYFDVNGGMSWFFAPSEYASLYAGVSLYHINKPEVGFFTEEKESLYLKTMFYGGGEFYMNDAFSIVPMAFYTTQGPSTELTVGTLFKKVIVHDYASTYGGVSVYAGGLYRNEDAFIALVKLDYGVFSGGLSYDINSSKLSKASNSYGAFEISLMYKALLFEDSDRSKDTPFSCPYF